MKLNTTKKWFTLIELLVVITIIWVLAVAALNYFGTQQAKARDSVRIMQTWKIEKWVQSFVDSIWMWPLTSDSQKEVFVEATWFDASDPEVSKYVKTTLACVKASWYTKESEMGWNLMWTFFAPYLLNGVSESFDPVDTSLYKTEYKKFMEMYTEQKFKNAWYLYKGIIEEDTGEYKYEIATVLENSSPKARKDWGSLWAYVYEVWTLVWDATHAITKSEAESCFTSTAFGEDTIK